MLQSHWRGIGQINITNQIFPDEALGYQSLYEKKTMPELLDWLDKLREGLYRYLTTMKSSHKNYTIAQIKKYIRGNIEERLNLNRVASAFSISPNYLSQLFKKIEGIGFSEYITGLKMERATEMLKNGSFRIYEVAQLLGYDNAFYFSRVFKKTMGNSPTEYLQIHGITGEDSEES